MPTTGTIVQRRDVFTAKRKRATDFHKIVKVIPGTITLMLVSRRRQQWGFYVPGTGKLPWHEYLESLDGTAFKDISPEGIT